jgi:hypothetical protein
VGFEILKQMDISENSGETLFVEKVYFYKDGYGLIKISVLLSKKRREI